MTILWNNMGLNSKNLIACTDRNTFKTLKSRRSRLHRKRYQKRNFHKNYSNNGRIPSSICLKSEDLNFCFIIVHVFENSAF